MTHINQKTGDKGYPPLVKTPTSLQAAGYTVNWDDGSASIYPQTWFISHPQCRVHNEVIARFEVDRAKGMISIHEAWNDARDPVKAFRLRDMVLNFWIFHTRSHPDDLKIIKIECIVQHEAKDILPKLYEKLEKYPERYINHDIETEEDHPPSVCISRKPAPDEDRRVHRSVWPTLCTRICFVKGVLHMLKEYAELKRRSIHSVAWTECGIRDWPDHGLPGHPCDKASYMTIHIGGEGTPSDQLDEIRQDALESRARGVRVVDARKARKAAEARLAAQKEAEDDNENEDPIDDEISQDALEFTGVRVIDPRRAGEAMEEHARPAKVEEAVDDKENEEPIYDEKLHHDADEAQPD